MSGRGAILSLALRLNWAHRARSVLLTLLVAVGMTVFLVVTELSRVSTVGLDDAIAQDAGKTGTYTIDIPTGLGLSVAELTQHVATAVDDYAAEPVLLVEVLPQVQPECPPYRELGPQQILVLRDTSGAPRPLPFGQNLPGESDFCLDGQEIPAAALYLPTAAEQRAFGIGIFIDSAYRPVVLSSTVGAVSYRFVLVTGRSADDRAAVQQAVRDHLVEAATLHGVADSEFAFVARVDGADSIRSASEGIRLVYAVIAWGVLLLGGLGLLVAELIVVRERTWFFGLARALGARSRHIVTLVLADIMLVLLSGTALALLLALAVEPLASSFAESAFAVDVQLVQASTLPQVFAGGLLVLVLAGVYPALRATRQDPLDVLEPKSS